MIFCPYCLGEHPELKEVDKEGMKVEVCPKCGNEIAPMYKSESQRYARTVISAVGFVGHGKTVYFGSLFHTIETILPKFWRDFSCYPIDAKSLNIVEDNMRELQRGYLPEKTLQNFSDPTILSIRHPANNGRQLFLFYDNSGETFYNMTTGVKYASYIKYSKTMTFFISLTDIIAEAKKSHMTYDFEAARLLRQYLLGMAELKADTAKQHLVVTVTKADEIVERLPTKLKEYLYHGHQGLEDLEHYRGNLYKISEMVKEFLAHSLRGEMFVNLAQSSFASVSYCIISALGAEPRGNRLSARMLPRRVMDPMVLAMYPPAVPKRWLNWLTCR
ncbi:MAG: hypothetical protein JRI50_11335 [Deltaproteobacteria bacterium]|nr:hypothetical protein [Deltaproteobacteria bacterium]